MIKRGKRILPSARDAFRCLTDDTGKFRLPVVFVTNAGNTFRQTKADELSELLGIKVGQFGYHPKTTKYDVLDKISFGCPKKAFLVQGNAKQMRDSETCI